MSKDKLDLQTLLVCVFVVLLGLWVVFMFLFLNYWQLKTVYDDEIRVPLTPTKEGIYVFQDSSRVDSIKVNTFGNFVVSVVQPQEFDDDYYSNNAPEYLWDFGDGSTVVTTNMPQTGHQYLSSGNFCIIVKMIYPYSLDYYINSRVIVWDDK